MGGTIATPPTGSVSIPGQITPGHAGLGCLGQQWPEAKVFELPGSGYSYDRVWKAAMSAMGNGMVVIYSHKPSGAIRSRMSNMPTGKVVGFFIRPTTPTASSYQIEIVSKEPVSLFKLPEATSWEPSVLKEFEAALNAR